MNRKRIVEKEEVLNHHIQAIWDVITDNEDFKWRTDLKEVKKLTETEFIEVTQDGYETHFEIIGKTMPTEYRFKITGTIFVGDWSGILQELAPGKTKITFREEIEFKNSFFKLMSYFLLNLNKIQETYFNDLKRKLGEKNE